MALRLKISPGSTPNNLLIDTTTTLEGLLDFDGSVGVYRSGDIYPDVRGNKTLTWKMWLDSSVATTSDHIILLSDASVNQLEFDGFIFLYDTVDPTNWLVSCSSISYLEGGTNMRLEIPTNIYNQELNCEIKKIEGNPLYFKINDVSLNIVSNNTSANASNQVKFGVTGGGGPTEEGLRNGTIWDIRVRDDDTLNIVHHWKGYPVGNEDSGWVDQIGNADASVVAKPGFTANLRDVTYSGGDSIGSKLLIAPPAEPQPPGAPTLYRPLDTSTLGTLDPSLAWLENADTSTYWVQVDDASNFSSLLYDVSGLTGFYYDVSDLSYSTDYYWRVAATNPVGTGDWSEERVFTTPSDPAPSFPTAGLEAYWNMDEVSGTVSDQTSNSNDLPTNSGVTYGETGILNDCVSINSTGYLQGTSDTVGTAAFSISAWIRSGDTAATKNIFDCGNMAWTAGYTFALDSTGDLSFTIWDVTGAGWDTLNLNLDDGEWYHVVVTHTGDGSQSGTKFYVDGVSKTVTGTSSNTLTANVGGTFRVGNDTVGFGNRGFRGNLDEIGVWSTVLTPTDVSTLYNFGNGLAYPGP